MPLPWNDPAERALDALASADKPTWGCRCCSMTTPDRGALSYTCGPCVARARAELAAYENPHTDQLTLTNWGMF